MIDLFDVLQRLGALGLLVWNLRETVVHGKKLVELETLLRNGLSSDVKELKAEIEEHIRDEEKRILTAVKRDPKARTRRHDQ